MTDQLLASILTSFATAASTAGVAITALVLNNKRFDLLERRMDALERRTERLEGDLKDFYRTQAETEKEIARLKDHTGLK